MTARITDTRPVAAMPTPGGGSLGCLTVTFILVALALAVWGALVLIGGLR